MYRNLEAELKRNGITRKKLAEQMGINISTVSAKLTGRAPLLLGEAELIAERVFKNQFTIKYLFDKSAG